MQNVEDTVGEDNPLALCAHAPGKRRGFTSRH
jgi:hypothetical protein